MNRLLKRANQRASLGGAAALLIGTSIVGQLLGFMRTKLVNGNWPAVGPQSTDAYFAAFKIPDFFFFTLAAGALGVAFIPILAERVEQRDRKGVSELSSSLLNLLAIVMAVVGVVIFVFAESLVHIVAPNLGPEQLHNAVTIMRFIAFNPLLFTISGIVTSVQQTYGRFFFYAIAPIVYNATIIMSIFLFKDSLGLIGLGVGAFVGAILQLLIACAGLGGLHFKYRPVIAWKNHDFRRSLRQLPPRSLDQGIDSINSIVETNLARRLGDGYLSWYENAYILHTAPTLLIGTAISTAAFPRLTERLARGRVDLFRRDFLRVLRSMIWITVPVVVIGWYCRGYLARVIYTNNAPEIAVIFGFLSMAIFFRTMYALISRYFYAHKDTLTPLLVSLFAIGLNITLAYMLSRPTAYGVIGLALAQSIVAMCEVVILSIIMIYRDPKLFDAEFWGGILKIMSVTGFTILTGFIMVQLFPLLRLDRGFITLTAKLSFISFAIIFVHTLLSYLFGLQEAKTVISKARQFIFRSVKI